MTVLWGQELVWWMAQWCPGWDMAVLKWEWGQRILEAEALYVKRQGGLLRMLELR